MKYLPSILAAAAAIAAGFDPQLKAFIGAHSGAFASVAAILQFVLHYLPSPKQ